mmetsp:Transcript_52128/g.63844  ORF Transcript_52128/g.63844 Transcript_52128/m.63844 type:complete len:222 (-) Transcript_52128:17-682(-)
MLLKAPKSLCGRNLEHNTHRVLGFEKQTSQSLRTTALAPAPHYHALKNSLAKGQACRRIPPLISWKSEGSPADRLATDVHQDPSGAALQWQDKAQSLHPLRQSHSVGTQCLAQVELNLTLALRGLANARPPASSPIGPAYHRNHCCRHRADFPVAQPKAEATPRRANGQKCRLPLPNRSPVCRQTWPVPDRPPRDLLLEDRAEASISPMAPAVLDNSWPWL